jgi:hypothetical protein
MLGQFPSKLYCRIQSTSDDPNKFDFQLKSFQSVPYFEKYSESVGSDANEVDNKLWNILEEALKGLSLVNKNVLISGSATGVERLKFLNDVAAVITKVPWGAILFQKYDTAELNYQYVLQVGNDRRVSRASSFPTQGFRRYFLNGMLSNAILKETQSGSSIAQGLRAMPSLVSTKISLPIGSFIGRILYPFGVSFLLPIFTLTLLREKVFKFILSA